LEIILNRFHSEFFKKTSPKIIRKIKLWYISENSCPGQLEHVQIWKDQILSLIGEQKKIAPLIAGHPVVHTVRDNKPVP
jgi:hypothetical protein